MTNNYMKDMEELVESIQNEIIKDYMYEALSCYMTKAYRGCIVLSCIALFEDLVKKLSDLGRYTPEARDIFTEVQKKINDQNVYEDYLLTQLRSKQLLSELDAQTINMIKDRRNKSAHPSGHKPSAEEARFLFSEVIRCVLSKKTIKATESVDIIIDRLNNSLFFPSSEIEEVVKIVDEEIENMDIRLYQYLVNQLVKKYSERSRITHKNIKLFLFALSKNNETEIDKIIYKSVIKKNIDNDIFAHLIIGILSINPAILLLFDQSTEKRLIKILNDEIDSVDERQPLSSTAHPGQLFYNWINKLGNNPALDSYYELIKKYIRKHLYQELLVNVIKENNILKDYYFAILNEMAGSTQFNESREFANNYWRIEKQIADIITEEEAFTLLVDVVYASEYGTYDSQHLVRNKFNSISSTKEKAEKYYINIDKSEIKNKISYYSDKYTEIFNNVFKKEIQQELDEL